MNSLIKYISFCLKSATLVTVLLFGTMTLSAQTNNALWNWSYGGYVSIPQGSGNRMIWHYNKAAFRAGYVSGSIWDDQNIGYNSFAAGIDPTASNFVSTALGFHSQATGYMSTALGCSSVASGDYGSTAMGYYTTAGGYVGATAFGRNTTVTSSASNGGTAMGYYTTVSGTHGGTAMGDSTTASGNYGATAMGDSSKASGNNGATAFGYYTEASGGGGSTALGEWTTSEGDHGATATGYYSQASGDGSFAAGYSSHADGDYSIAAGYGSTAAQYRGSTSYGFSWINFAFGWNVESKATACFVVGKNNKRDSTVFPSNPDDSNSPLFIVGNGVNTDTNSLSNAFVVKANGDVIIPKAQGDISMGEFE